jgi:hypothetical protein
MVASKVADRATVSSNSTVTTADFVLTGMTVGNVLIIRTAADNSGGGGAARNITVTNQSGTPINLTTDIAYQRNNDPGAASAGVTVNVVLAEITATSGTVRITYSGSVVQAGVAEEWSGLKYPGAGLSADVIDNVGTASTNLASLALTNVVSGNVAYGAIAIEGPNADTFTQDADTTNGSWSNLTKLATTNATADTNMAIVGGYKIVSATGNQTYNPTNSVARDSAGIFLSLGAVVDRVATIASNWGGWTGTAVGTVPPLVTQAAYRFYADGTESGSTALAAQDTPASADLSGGDLNAQVRVQLQSTNAIDPASTDDWQLQYELNGDTNWFDVGVAEQLAETYDDTNAGPGVALTAANISHLGQSVTGDGRYLTKAGFYIQKVGTPTGTLTAQLYAHTGTFGSSGTATGAALATSNSMNAAAVSTSFGWVEFAFPTPTLMTAGTHYCIVLTNSGDASPNFIAVSVDDSSPTHEGNRVYFQAGAWNSNSINDHLFRVYTSDLRVVAHNSTNLTDGAATTNRLGAGSGSFVAGEISEDGLVDDFGWTDGDYTELLYSITLLSTGLVVDDTLAFRVLRNGSTDGITYTATPEITVAEPAITQAAYRWYADGTESGATALAAQDTAHALSADADLALRVRLQSTSGGGPAATDDFRLDWRVNAGAWTAVGTQATADEHDFVTYYSTTAALSATITSRGQSFTGNGSNLMSVSWFVTAVGLPTGANVVAEVFAHSGTYGVDGVPTGSALATSSPLDIANMPLDPQEVAFDFDGTFNLVNGTRYFVTVRSTVPDDDDTIAVAVDNSGSDHAGNPASLSGSWSADTNDLCFTVFTEGPVVGFASANLTDGGATTNRLTGGSGSFTAGKISEDGAVENVGWAEDDYTELLYSLHLTHSAFVDGDTVEFRVVRNGATTGVTYSQTPTIDISAGTTVAVGQASETDTAQAITRLKTHDVTMPLPGVPATTDLTAAASPQTLTLPTRNVGDLLLAFCEVDGTTPVITGATGWTLVNVRSNTGVSTAVLARLATNDAGDACSLAATGSSLDWHCAISAVTQHSVTDVSTLISNSTATGGSVFHNPDSLSAAGSAIWFTAAGASTGSPIVPSSGGFQAPNAIPLVAVGSVASGALAVQYRRSYADSEDPGTMSFDTTANYASITVALPPGFGRETDTAQAITVRRTYTLGQASETDTAQTITRATGVIAVGQASEADTAQAITVRRTYTLGQASETDTAQRLAIPLGRATETDTAQAITRVKVVAVGQTSETDAAQTLTRVKTRGTGPLPTVADSTTGTISVTGTAPFTVNRPSSTQIGDLVLHLIQTFSAGPTGFTPPSEFTEVRDQIETGLAFGVYATIATAAGAGSDSFSMTSAAGTVTGSYASLRIAGHGENPISGLSISTSIATGVNTSTAPSASGAGGARRLFFVATGVAGSTIDTDPTYWTNVAHVTNGVTDLRVAQFMSSDTFVRPNFMDLSDSSNTWVTVTIGIDEQQYSVAETDLAQPLVVPPIGRAFETDTAQPITATHLQDLVLLTPADASTVDLADGETFTWHQPGDQTEFAFKRRLMPTGTWQWWNGTGWQDTETFISSAVEAVTIGAGDW